ncbi:RICIN domain-containing protein [Lentzea sp. NPDC055074]
MGKIAAALSVAILALTGLAAPARAADEPIVFSRLTGSIAGAGGKIYFQEPGNRTDKCLDAALEEIDRDGGKVQMWKCGFGGDEQIWTWAEHPLGGTQIINKANGKCLDVALEEIDQEGGRLQLWQCTGSIEQAWYVSPHMGDLFLDSRATKGSFGAPGDYDGAPVGLYRKS